MQASLRGHLHPPPERPAEHQTLASSPRPTCEERGGWGGRVRQCRQPFPGSIQSTRRNFLAIATASGGQIPCLLITVCIFKPPSPIFLKISSLASSRQAWSGWEKTQLPISSAWAGGLECCFPSALTRCVLEHEGALPLGDPTSWLRNTTLKPLLARWKGLTSEFFRRA